MAEKCFQFIMAVISDIGQRLKETFFSPTRSQLEIKEGCNHYSSLDAECLKASYTTACILLPCHTPSRINLAKLGLTCSVYHTGSN